MKLTATNVHDIFMKCLFDDKEQKDKYVLGHGVMTKVGFHPGRLEENKEKVFNMLADLPDQFMKTGGGGWSFLNLCQDKDGNQWADMHRTMDELVCLGVAVGAVEFQMPREMWSILPGGMPYLSVSLPVKEVKEVLQ